MKQCVFQNNLRHHLKVFNKRHNKILFLHVSTAYKNIGTSVGGSVFGYNHCIFFFLNRLKASASLSVAWHSSRYTNVLQNERKQQGNQLDRKGATHRKDARKEWLLEVHNVVVTFWKFSWTTISIEVHVATFNCNETLFPAEINW